MVLTGQNRMGEILRNKVARSILERNYPGITNSELLIFARDKTLDEFAVLDPSAPWPAGILDAIKEDLLNVSDMRHIDVEDRPVENYEAETIQIGSASMLAPQCVNRWDVFELELHGPSHGNPFVDVYLTADFSLNGHTIRTQGFYDGDGVYRIRFMPVEEGLWEYHTTSSARSLDQIQGQFICTERASGNHGLVRVKNTFHFAYEDGTRYIPVGTTCYAWTHQSDEIQNQTLDTLKSSPFNKLRMCVFPKWYLYNLDEPTLFPFEGNLEDGWDFSKFNPEFFRKLENRIRDLGNLGIEADLIIFHPYDKWGFSEMTKEADDRYLRYLVARLSAYHNIWWSLANEFDLMWSKSVEDWERFAHIIREYDPYSHLTSIHNCHTFYDNNRPWITHCSIQRIDVYKTAENVNEWRDQWNKPIVIDECAYEGDIDQGWGNISGEEMVRRFWEGAVRGGYVGHGETYMDPDDILWWSKGGKLRGNSPKRIAFLKNIMDEGYEDGWNPISTSWDVVSTGNSGGDFLFYYGFNQPSFREFRMTPGTKYKVEIIDTWNMTIEALEETFEGAFQVKLPVKKYMAIRMTKIN